MREIKPLKRNNNECTNINADKCKNINLVLNFLDTLIEGKRFGEFDSSKQMYLFGCQARIQEMKLGYYTEADVEFLKTSIQSLKIIINNSEIELNKILNKEDI